MHRVCLRKPNCRVNNNYYVNACSAPCGDAEGRSTSGKGNFEVVFDFDSSKNSGREAFEANDVSAIFAASGNYDFLPTIEARRLNGEYNNAVLLRRQDESRKLPRPLGCSTAAGMTSSAKVSCNPSRSSAPTCTTRRTSR